MKFIQLFISLSIVITLASCSTVEGMGKDLQTLGKAMKKIMSQLKLMIKSPLSNLLVQ